MTTYLKSNFQIDVDTKRRHYLSRSCSNKKLGIKENHLKFKECMKKVRRHFCVFDSINCSYSIECSRYETDLFWKTWTHADFFFLNIFYSYFDQFWNNIMIDTHISEDVLAINHQHSNANHVWTQAPNQCHCILNG